MKIDADHIQLLVQHHVKDKEVQRIINHFLSSNRMIIKGYQDQIGRKTLDTSPPKREKSAMKFVSDVSHKDVPRETLHFIPKRSD